MTESEISNIYYFFAAFFGLAITNPETRQQLNMPQPPNKQTKTTTTMITTNHHHHHHHHHHFLDFILNSKFISGSDDFLERMVYTMQSRTTCLLNRWSGVFEDNGRECRLFAKHGSSHRHLCLGEVCVGLHTHTHTHTHTHLSLIHI